MTDSSPRDLAVAFRSFSRRRDEAIGDSDPHAVADLSAQLDEHIHAAATALGVTADAETIAGELERRRPEQWDDETLTAVRGRATDAGRVLRTIAERVEAERSED